MFVYDFIQFQFPFEAVKQQLVSAAWIAPLATSAYHPGPVTVALGLDGAPSPVHKDVRVELDTPIEQDGIVVVPIRWQATGAARLFPVLHGHLEASPLQTGGTHVSLLAHYDPPGGAFGRLADRMSFHHLAEAGIRSFLRRVAGVLLGAEGPRAPGQPLVSR